MTRRIIARTVGLVTVFLVCAHQLPADPFPGWSYRSQVRLDNAAGTENLVNFPIPVLLDSSNFDFSRAKADGSDLRFADPDDTVLDYEVEQWDPVGRQGVIWVNVPQIDLASSTDYVNMYYGNPGAADAQNAPAVWANGYQGVWHLDGTGAAVDSTGGGHAGALTGGGVGSAAGILGDSRSFDAGNSRIEVPQHADLNVADDITVSYWMNGSAAQPGGYTRVISKNNDGVPGWEYQRGGADPHQNIRLDTSGGNNQVRRTGNDVFNDTWRFVGTTVDSGTVKGYRDGDAPLSYSYNHGTGLGNTLPLVIGARSNGGNPFQGLIDEVRFSDTVRSDAWMNAEYRAQSGQLTAVSSSDFRAGLIAEYSHEDSVNRVRDMTGNGHDATSGGSGGGVAFVPVADPQGFDAGLGTTVGSYVRSQAQHLNIPSTVHTPGDSFTFTALVNTSDPGDNFRTILSTNRFRYQRSTGGVYRIDVNNPPGGNNYFATGSGVFQDNTWYFAALRYDAITNTGDMFLQPASPILRSSKLSFAPTNPLTNLTSFRIGGDGLSGIGGFDGWGGLIDNARFYQGALDKRQLRDVLYSYTGFSGQVGLVARYDHEGPDPLTDDTGHGLDAANRGDVAFVAPPSPGDFQLGSVAGEYPRSGNGSLDIPDDYHMPGDDFTFVAMVRKNSDESGGHQTVLGTNRFRFQYRDTGGVNGAGTLRLDVNAAGASGPGESGDNTFQTEQWYFTALTYNAATKSIDAYLQSDSPAFFPAAFSRTANGAIGIDDMTRFRVGGDGLSGIGGFDAFGGHIDGIRFYDQTFTRREMRDVFREYNPVPGGIVGLVAKYDHEGGDPLADDTGHGLDATNAGGVAFVAPPSPGQFDLGGTAGEYPRAGNGYLSIPDDYHMPGDDFTFIAMVRKNNDESGGHQTILGTNRFRFQFQNTGSTSDGAGQLRLDVNSPGASGTDNSGAGSFLTDEWYFTALAYDAADHSIRSYLQPDAPIFLGPAFARTANGTLGLDDMRQFRVGMDGLSGIGGSDAFGGHIDGIRFYDQALSTSQLRDVFATIRTGPVGPFGGLVAKYDHEGPDPLTDDTGHGLDATNGGSVTFVAPPAPGVFQLGSVAGEYPRNGTGFLDVPTVHGSGDDFTFVAMVRKDAAAPGHQTILSTDRFRFQFRGTSADAGRLRLDVNGSGSGTSESADGTFQTEQWYYVAMTYDASTNAIQAWLQDDSPVFLGPDFTRTSDVDSMLRFRLGMDGLSFIGSDDAFGGHIDGIRFYDTLLSKRELRQVFRTYNPLPAGTVGLVAQYEHEGADPLTDDTGHRVTPTNRGDVSFVAPLDPGNFVLGLGDVAGSYPRTNNGSLDVPQLHTPGDDFTFVAFVRKNDDESGGHQTILGSNRFRFQFRNTGTTADAAGTLRLDVNAAGASGPGESGDGTFLTEEWYFTALRYDADTHLIEAFLQDDSSKLLSGPVFTRTANGAEGIDDMTSFRIGGDGLSGIGGFDSFGGQIDGVRFYDLYLSDAQLQDILTNSYIPEPATFVLLALGLAALPLLRRRRRASRRT